ncbi:hypothetical protein AVEN_180494-1 [Araneus ventricosus]|uniref:Uncharacterized protein n=1 Tax=Araneus ventricosus TaxID=182803 RepID=A0A4Y2EXA8_ARAVE|nr:hypothetical protein AVEN_180494-1 [Araneus ventricosus]
MLSIPSEIIAVENFIELSEAVKYNGYKCYVFKGTSPVDFMIHNEKEHLRFLAEMADSHEWYVNDLPLTEQIDYHSAVMESRTRLLMVAGPEEWKPHFLSDDSLITYKLAVAMKKNFCYKRKLNTVISRINSAGLYKQFTKEEHFKYWLSASERKRDISKQINPLSLQDLSGAFGVILVGLLIGIIIFIYEVTCHRIGKMCLIASIFYSIKLINSSLFRRNLD